MAKIKLFLYIILHCFTLTLNPVKLVHKIKKSFYIWKNGGFRQLYIHFLSIYLVQNYLLKTKVKIRLPSQSIYKKIFPLLPDDFYKEPAPRHFGMSAPLKILIIRLGAMGDVLFTTPLIKKLHDDRNGFVEIYVATRHPEVFSNNPYIKGLINPKNLKSLRTNFGMILDLDLAYQNNKHAHLIDVFLYYAIGRIPTLRELDKKILIFSSANDIQLVNKFIEKIDGKFIVCHNRLDPIHKYKGVSFNLWNELMIKLAINHDLKIIQIGGLKFDIALSSHPNFIDARNKLTLQQTKELIELSEFFVGIDAGPLHIAAATKTPIVSFFTQSHSSSRMPLRQNLDNKFIPISPNIDCYGCTRKYPLPYGFECSRGDSICSESFLVDDAYNKCLNFIDKKDNE